MSVALWLTLGGVCLVLTVIGWIAVEWRRNKYR